MRKWESTQTGIVGRRNEQIDTGTPGDAGRQLEFLTLQKGMGTPMRVQTRVKGTDIFKGVIHPNIFEGVFWTDTVESVFRIDTVEGAIFTDIIKGVACL